MTLFRRREPRLKVWKASSRRRWRAGLDWWDKVEIDASSPYVSRWRRLRARLVVTVGSTLATCSAVVALIALLALATVAAATIGIFPALFLNTRHLVRVTWADHWKGE